FFGSSAKNKVTECGMKGRKVGHVVGYAAWVCFIGYEMIFVGWRALRSADVFDVVIFVFVSVAVLLSLIRRERIEIYPDRMVWSKTYFGFTRSNVAPLADILGADWSEGDERGRQGKGPDYVEFY